LIATPPATLGAAPWTASGKQYPPLALEELPLWPVTKVTSKQVTEAVVLILLAVLWVVVLLPPYLKNKDQRAFRPGRSDNSSIAAHRTQLSVLNQSLGTTTMAPNVIPFRRPEQVGSPVVAALSNPQPPQRSFAGLAAQATEAPEFAFGPESMSFAGGPSMSSEQARRRRRSVLSGLGGAAIVTLFLAVIGGGTLLVMLHLLTDLALLGFVLLLVRHQQMENERANKVAPIFPVGHTPRLQAAPQYLVRQSSAR